MKCLTALAVLLIVSTPAQATEWLVCSDGDKASISVLLGQMEVIAVAEITMEVGPKKWSTRGDGATPVAKGQAFETKDQIWIDVTDANVNAIVAELRLFKAAEGEHDVTGGTLRVIGEGAWAVSCTGP